jgi:hypothetical protein
MELGSISSAYRDVINKQLCNQEAPLRIFRPHLIHHPVDRSGTMRCVARSKFLIIGNRRDILGEIKSSIYRNNYKSGW